MLWYWNSDGEINKLNRQVANKNTYTCIKCIKAWYMTKDSLQDFGEKINYLIN